MRISDWSSDVCSSDLPCQTFAKAHDSDGYAFCAKHAARAAGRGWLLFTTVGFVAHWRQQPCFAASFAPIWTSAAILAADPHLWLRQYLQEVGTRSEEHTSELQSLISISYAVFCFKKNKTT